MIFNSNLFLFYFLPILLMVYYLIDRRYRNMTLLLAGIIFYAWGAPSFVFVVAATLVADYLIAGWMVRKTGRLKKVLFWISVMINLGLLLYFKYMNFFLDQAVYLFSKAGWSFPEWGRIALPIGISFITFQKLAYTFDVYKSRFSPFTRFQDFALYIFMFPQLLSGPIVRPGQIAAQISGTERDDALDTRLSGFYRFAIGMARKVLIADTLALQVNEIFALEPFQLSSALAWTGAVAYTFQIYFDFSGYTDMAIGLARMLGYRLPENFRNPYISGSVTEFWRRWHITLSFWFRDYVFLPLAYATSRKLPRERYLGLRADKVIYLIATSVTFILCGFWHGAAWTFILWGVWQGLFLILDRLFLLKWMKKTGKFFPVLLTFFITTLGWVIFRSESVGDGWIYLQKMFAFTGGVNDVWLTPKFFTMLGLAIFFSFIGLLKGVEDWQDRFYLQPGNKTLLAMFLPALLLLFLSAATITSSGFNPFIYFRF